MRFFKTCMLAACLLMGVSMRAFADGESCSRPITITKDFQLTVSEEGEIWFVANTFDLPLAFDYYPTLESQKAPELDLDFGCTPGTYGDSILCSLFCWTNPGYLELPHHEELSSSYDKDGNLRYHVEMGLFYRDLLLKQGIDYNVKVYIKATFHGSGHIGISPDPFSTCMDGVKFIHLGDTVRVKAEDAIRHVIVPYVQWQNDSIRYIWTGEKQVILAIMGKNCDFDPLDNADENMLQWRRMQPGETLKMTSDDIKHYLDDNTKQKDGGMYYAKFYSTSAGVMKIERVPLTPPEGGAILLSYGKDADIRANGIDDLYAIPSSWNQATLFSTPTNNIFRMYVGTSTSFTPETAIADYQFDKLPNGHQLALLENDMAALQKQAVGKYLYLRFQCTQATTVRPTLWAPSECVTTSERIKLSAPMSIAARSKANFRLLYADVQGGDMTIEWKCQTGACPFFIGDSCITPDENDPHVFYTGKISKNNKVEIAATEIESWRQRVDGDGYLFALFNPNNKGTITITTTAPGETDPDYPRTTINVVCADETGKNLTVRVSVAQYITIENEGGVVEKWDAIPDEPRFISLDAGSYRLRGESEELTIYVP